jgi:hypothetical protein
MLMKLIPVVNFINVLRERFSYKSYILAAFLVTFCLWRQNFVQKMRASMLMKLIPDCGWIDASLICEEEQISSQQNVKLFVCKKRDFEQYLEL